MAAVAAEVAATTASPGERGNGEAELEMEPIPGSEASADTLPVKATEASVPVGEANGQQSAPQANKSLELPQELARSLRARPSPFPHATARPARLPRSARSRRCPSLQLIPSSELWVKLDHIIEDALVVSFRLGELFPRVLMDLSKR